VIATYATFVDFSTPSDWTLTGEAEAGGGSLTMTQPWHNAYWNAANWGETPPFSNNGNDHAILEVGTTYIHSLGGAPRELGNFQVNLSFSWPGIAPALGTWFVVSRNEVAVDGGSWAVQNGWKGASSYREWLVDVSDLRRVADTGLQLTEGAFYDYQTQCYGTTWNVVLGGEVHWKARSMTALDVSYLKIHGSNCNGTQLLCGAGVDGQSWPIVSTHAIGAAELKTASGWVTPTDTVDILRVVPRDNPHGIGSGVEQFCDIAYQYKYGAGAWTDLPDNGDVSGISPVADAKLLVRVDNGAGTGMDNYRDMRLAPEVFGFEIIHTQTIDLGGGGGHIERRNVGMIGGRE